MIGNDSRQGLVRGLAVLGALAVIAVPSGAQTRTVTLEEAIDMAVKANPQVVQARGQLDIAGASRREAIGGWLPSLNFNSGWSTNSAQRFDQATQRIVTGNSSSFSGGVSASLTLFDGFRTLAQNRSANANMASADAALTSQEFQITLSTKQSFFNALAANELVRVAETQVQRAEEQLKIARDKLAAGSAIRSDTLSALVGLQNAQLTRLQAETQRATAEANLARLIGADGTVRPVADSSLFAPVAVDTAELRAEALEQSPQVAQADANAKAADAQVAVARGQYLPTISASYSNSYAGVTLDSLRNNWSFRLSASWPLFNGFSREASVTRAAANRETAQAQADDARRQVNAQLTQYLASLDAAQTRAGIAQSSRAAAEEDLRIQRERYRLGAATIVDVLASQVSLDQAEVDLVQARLDYLVAKAQIEALVGREL